jgi:hypothetical protein
MLRGKMGNKIPLKYKIFSYYDRIRQRIPILRGKPPKLTRLWLENSENITPEQLENARVGYMGAINCAAYCVNAIWSIFNSMLMANSVIFLGIGFIFFTHREYSNYILIFLSATGVFLCLVWLSMIYQNIKFNEYYINSARELEERYFLENVQTLSRGGEFSTGEKAYMTIGGKITPFQLILWQRIPPVMLAYSVIIIFSIIYFAILVLIVYEPIHVFLVHWG